MASNLTDPRVILAALLAGFAVARVAWAIVRPPARLANRVRPYTIASRSALGRRPDTLVLADSGSPVGRSDSVLVRLLGPPVMRLVDVLGGLVDRGGDERLLLRLKHAGVLGDVPEARRALQYRVQVVSSAALATAAGLGLGLLVGQSAGAMLAVGCLGLVFGLAWPRGRLDRLITRRREEMRVELYTVNHLLAMHVRVGGGVIQALQRVVERGSGAVVAELAEVLRAHRSGVRISAALTRAAAQSAEPHAARTYRLLAASAEHGADLARGLMDLSRDLHSQRREDLRRLATRQRAATIVPIVAILAPVLLLFVAAPLPSIVFGGLAGR
ncbi:MAG TPA: type II secretion system F family protein [Actinomycetota bacterium]|nr:type II secretion system F family protein [Actinomycetota bacterium]